MMSFYFTFTCLLQTGSIITKHFFFMLSCTILSKCTHSVAFMQSFTYVTHGTLSVMRMFRVLVYVFFF